MTVLEYFPLKMFFFYFWHVQIAPIEDRTLKGRCSSPCGACNVSCESGGPLPSICLTHVIIIFLQSPTWRHVTVTRNTWRASSHVTDTTVFPADRYVEWCQPLPDWSTCTWRCFGAIDSGILVSSSGVPALFRGVRSLCDVTSCVVLYCACAKHKLAHKRLSRHGSLVRCARVSGVARMRGSEGGDRPLHLYSVFAYIFWTSSSYR